MSESTSSNPQTPSDRAGAAALDWAAARGEKWRAHVSGMEATLAPVDEPLIEALRLDAPMRVAEIGCGGGGTTLEILRRAPAGSVVHGFDISPALVDFARTRSRNSAPHFALADMGTTRPPEAAYDRLASRFGIMFFDNPPAAFRNLAAWLLPGGRFAFATWANPKENLWLASVREIVARFVEIPPTDPDAPGPFRYAESGKLLALLEQAGFGELAVRDWRGTLPIGAGLPPLDAANFALAAFSSFGELLAERGAEAYNGARDAVAELFARHLHDGVVRLEAGVHIFTGARPT